MHALSSLARHKPVRLVVAYVGKLEPYVQYKSSQSSSSVSEYLTPAEVAAVLKVTPESVIKRFEKLPGVIDIGAAEARFKRRYRVLRIPRETLNTFLVESRVA
jgi:hypothetical protein